MDIIAGLLPNEFGYRFLLLLHLLAVIVGFGSSFVYPVLAAKARQMEPPQSYAINSTATAISKYLTTYPIYAAGLFGVILVGASDQWKFSQTWVSIALFLFIVAVLIAAFLHVPNLKAMVGLQEKLATGKATPTQGGPPAEVAELQERGGRAGLYGGILHLLFLLLVIDMIWKPGYSF